MPLRKKPLQMCYKATYEVLGRGYGKRAIKRLHSGRHCFSVTKTANLKVAPMERQKSAIEKHAHTLHTHSQHYTQGKT